MTCLYCGTPLPADAMFCVECGRPVRSAHQPPVGPRDTAIIEPLPEPQRAAGAGAEEGGASDDPIGDHGVDDPIPEVIPAEPGHAAPGERDELAVLGGFVESEQPSRSPGQNYVLQFSTGEIVAVTGSGLIGRNPSPQPTEYFDHLVTIVDPARSVSKTHLEFGQERGALWISDRFSANGTVVVVPGDAPRRCDPGKRINVARGSRVDIAEQYFIVS